MRKLKCANCYQEILADDQVECPYCHSKNLIPIDEKFPLNPWPKEQKEQDNSLYDKPKQRETIFALLGTIIFIASIGLMWYGSTQPPNITTGTEFGHPDNVSVFFFVGEVLMLVGSSCYGFWMFAYASRRRKRNASLKEHP